jgi:hypothetical protein
MSNQIVISSGAKVRELEGVLTGTSGIVNALGINVPSGIPQLDGSGKILVSQLPNSVMEYKGSWNAATNTPTLVNGTGNAGDVYLCEVAGTVNFGAGPITFAVGDQVIYSGSIWQRASGATGTVTSVAVTESGDALTITGSPITTSGTINVGFAGNSGQYVNGAGGLTTFPSLTGYVPYTGATASVNLGAYDLIASGIYGTFIEASVNGLASSPLVLRTGTTGFSSGTDAVSLISSPTSTHTLSIISNIASPNVTKRANIGLDSLSATRTFTLPDLSGTLALLEGTQTFTGGKTFSSNINADSGIRLKNGVAPSANGYVGIGSNTQGLTLGIYDSGSVYYQELYFPYTNGYQYTFPAATGTLALTSDLSSYVPYTGATTNVDLGSNYITSATIVFWKGTGSGLGNIGIGRIVPLGQNTTGQGNIGIGENSLFSNTTGSNNIAIGVSSTQANTTGINNIGIGLGSNSNNVTGSGNVAVGVGALNFNTNNYNTAVGHLALYFNTTGTNNVAIGYSSLYTNTTGSQNTALGSGTLYSNTTASNNTAIGNQALQQNTTGVNNTAIGSFSSYLNTTGQNNTSVGTSSLRNNTTGESNTAIGSTTLNNNTTGINNTGIGFAVLSNSTTASNNVAIGYASGVNISTGSNNTLVTGGSAITTGSNNTIIGNYAGTTTLANNIVLADGAGNIRYQFDGTNNIFTSNLNGTSASFASSGGSDTFAINHSSGSGIALNITKGGNGEGLYINKTSGTGNAATIVGNLGGTSATFSSTLGVTGALSGTSATFSGNVMIGSGTAGRQLEIYNANDAYMKFNGQRVGNNAFTIGNDNSGFVVYDDTNGAYRLTIANNGAATFSSSVTVTNDLNVSAAGNLFVAATSGIFFNGAGSFSTGIYNDGSAILRFATNGSERMRITSSGNVGIGTSSPTNTGGYATLTIGGNSTTKGQLTFNSSTTPIGYLYNDATNMNIGSENALIFATNSTAVERMRITSGGNVLIGATSTFGAGRMEITYNGSSQTAFDLKTSTTDGNNIRFFNSSNSVVGRIYSDSTSTLYVITSDYRLKQDFKDYDGLNLISKIKTYDYQWKNDKSRMFGVIAHELQEILPYAVNGEKDGKDMQGVDYSKIVPILIKSIQELESRIKQLENK